MIRDIGVVPKVSVVIPTYNRADNLSTTIAHLLQQTLTNIEIVVADDGSTDHTCQVLEAIADRRVRYVRKAHLGMPKILIEGVKETRGEYIMFCHDHDIYSKDMLAELASALDRHTTAAYAHCGIVVVDPEGNNEIERYVRPYPEFMTGREFLTSALLPHLDSHVTALTMVRRATLEQEGIDPLYEQCADVELWMRLCTIGDVAYVRKPLIRVRQRDSTSQMYFRGLRLASLVLQAKRKYIQYIPHASKRRAILIGWQRYSDRTAIWALLLALENRKALDLTALRDFVYHNGTRHGRLIFHALSALPTSATLAILKAGRSLRRFMNRGASL